MTDVVREGIHLGETLQEHKLRKVLTELNPDISFDAAVNRPSEYGYLFSEAKKYEPTRGSIYYQGRFVCAIDRGVIPENTIQPLIDGLQEIRMCDIERYDDTKVCYVEILTTDPFYHEALTRAEKKDDNFTIDGDGRVFKYTAMRFGKVPGPPVRVGWRHTLGRLVQARIPGIDQPALEARLGVRL